MKGHFFHLPLKMTNQESNVVRIVNLNDSFTEETLKSFILITCRIQGDVKKIYLKRDDTIKTFYGYVVFEHSNDALKMTQTLNGFTYNTNKFEVELIGPNLKYHKYEPEESRSTLFIRGMLNNLQERQSVNRKILDLSVQSSPVCNIQRGNLGFVRSRPVSNIQRGNNNLGAVRKNLVPNIQRGNNNLVTSNGTLSVSSGSKLWFVAPNMRYRTANVLKTSADVHQDEFTWEDDADLFLYN